MATEFSPELRRRQYVAGQLDTASLPPLLHRLYAQRGVTALSDLHREVKFLHPFQSLHGIDKATILMQQALIEQRRIVVIGDFDADGATSTALTVLALRAMGGNDVHYLIPNRFENGYGLSPEVVEQAALQGAELIVTVDNGISSHAGVICAHDKNIQVIITDHHLPGEALPDADAIVNPNLRTSTFPSRSLAGVGVAFYLMVALRARLRESGVTMLPNLASLLDLVALGTVADVVPLDANNRILVWQGLCRIRAGQCRPGIRALLEVTGRSLSGLTASDLGFALGPRLNAAGRLDDMSVGVALLLTEDPSEARMLASKLDTLNQTRKMIEKEMEAEALVLCNKFAQSDVLQPLGLALYHPDWHQGVVGIIASRLKDRFHRPVIAFAPAGDGTLKGSARSIDGVHMRDALERLESCQPGLMLKFGGHAMAAGVTIVADNFTIFQDSFTALMQELLSEEALQGVIWSDGELLPDEMTLDTAGMLREAGPWGQAFPEPIFDGKFKLLQQRLLAGHHLKMILEPLAGGPLLDGIAFNIDSTRWPDTSVKQVEAVYKLDINQFRGNCNLQLIIQHFWPA